MNIKEKVNVQLKNIKTFRGHEGIGLNADIYINGLKCMNVFDDAFGGEYEFTSYQYFNEKEEQIKNNIQLLNDYIATLLEVQIFSDRTDLLVKVNLDRFIAKLLSDIENEKILRNLKKKEVNHIIFGLPNGDRFFLKKLNTKLSKIPLNDMINLLNIIKKNNFKDGYIFFNTNFKELGINVDNLNL